MNIIIDSNHPRIKKAQFARRLRLPNSKIFLNTAAPLLVLASVGLYVIDLKTVGLLIASVASLLVSIIIWREGELKDLKGFLPADDGSLNLATALDRRSLGRIDSFETPYDIWNGIKGSWREMFFTVRYGIDRNFIESNISRDASDNERIWQQILQVARHENQESITIAAIYVGLLASINGYDDYLAKLHLEPQDLIVGVDWQRHLELTKERFASKDHFGGMARDWSAGYTPIMSRLGRNISNQIQFSGGLLNRSIAPHISAVDQMVKIMSESPRANIAVIGPSGSGKTNLIKSFAATILSDDSEVPSNIRYHQVVEINAPSILSQVDPNISVEVFVHQMMGEIQNAKNTIIFFDQAEHFFNNETGEVNLGSVLLPILQDSRVRMIFAMDDDAWSQVLLRHHAVASLMNKIVLSPTSKEETFRIMEDQILRIEFERKVVFRYQALQEAYRLSDRYIHDMDFPGKAVRLLESSANYAVNGVVAAQSIQAAVEQTMGVKVSAASAEEKKELLNLEDDIHKHMVNQTRAVKVVSDALRRARSGVNNPNKPIGTFMFLGPTGVGKTELAKAIGRVYFGGEDRLIRVDMNNYVQASDVSRLLAAPLENSTGLIAQVSKQPFSVVLFDEIEKAHPDVVNIFLQLLDEGVLRDTNNKQVSFKDTIVITTSNAGADKIRDYIEKGVELQEFEKQFIDQLINDNLFKPEFLNRFDEMVVFRPLTQDELLQVVDLLIASVNKNLSRQKVQVKLTDDAKQWLVQNGYDARLGARPLRRMIQRSVENIVAVRLLQDDFKPGSTLMLNAEDLAASGAGE